MKVVRSSGTALTKSAIAEAVASALGVPKSQALKALGKLAELSTVETVHTGLLNKPQPVIRSRLSQKGPGSGSLRKPQLVIRSRLSQKSPGPGGKVQGVARIGKKPPAQVSSEARGKKDAANKAVVRKITREKRGQAKRVSKQKEGKQKEVSKQLPSRIVQARGMSIQTAVTKALQQAIPEGESSAAPKKSSKGPVCPKCVAPVKKCRPINATCVRCTQNVPGRIVMWKCQSCKDKVCFRCCESLAYDCHGKAADQKKILQKKGRVTDASKKCTQCDAPVIKRRVYNAICRLCCATSSDRMMMWQCLSCRAQVCYKCADQEKGHECDLANIGNRKRMRDQAKAFSAKLQKCGALPKVDPVSHVRGVKWCASKCAWHVQSHANDANEKFFWPQQTTEKGIEFARLEAIQYRKKLEACDPDLVR